MFQLYNRYQDLKLEQPYFFMKQHCESYNDMNHYIKKDKESWKEQCHQNKSLTNKQNKKQSNNSTDNLKNISLDKTNKEKHKKSKKYNLLTRIK